jgi:hypothetical protein
MPVATDARRLEWGCATRPRVPGGVSGDLAIVVPAPRQVIVAVVDGLGHGPEAARAAGVAAAVVRARAADEPGAIVRGCHAALRGTRGAAIALAAVSTRSATMTWLGIGNVEARLVRRRRTSALALARGVAGGAVHALAPATVELERGDLILFATDGVDAAFADSFDPAGSTAAIAGRLLARHRRSADDALVVAVRYLGEGGA